MLTVLQQQNVCLLYNGGAKQCRYIKQDDVDFDKWYCLKKRKIEKQKIDDKVNLFVQDCLHRGADPMQANVPLGNNCAGYPVLKYIDQGYDVP